MTRSKEEEETHMRAKQEVRKPIMKAHQRAVTTEQRLKVKVAIKKENLRGKIQPSFWDQLWQGARV